MNQTLLRPLFCKPLNHEIVYDKLSPSLSANLQFRSLDLEKELGLIHAWVNMDYTRTFWQMRGSLGLLRSCYQCILQNPFAHSFIGMLDHNPVCQFDIYQVSSDELGRHISFEENDCGFHLLMAPAEKTVHGLTVAIIRAFLEFYFTHPAASSMFAEPDVTNQKSIELLERSGFERIKTIEMSYKTAHVYQLTKQNFYEKNSRP